MALVQQILQTCQLSKTGITSNLQQADLMFKEMFNNAEFAPSCMQILNDAQIPEPIKQTVSIHFKHYLKINFNNYSAEMQVTVKNALFQLMITMPFSVQLQLIEAFRIIIIHCFPNNCADVMQNITTGLTNQQILSNENSFRGLFMVINTICKNYRFRTDEYPFMIQFVRNIFPQYMQILQTAVQNKLFSYTKQLFKLLKYILYTEIPPFFNQQVVAQIYTLILQFMQIPLTFDENAEKNDHCSSLVGIMRATCFFINHNTSKKQRRSQIVTYFVEQIAPTFIQQMINHFNSKLPEKLMFFDIQVLSYSLKTSKLTAIILQFFPQLFEKILFPQIMISDDIIESMVNDPIDYLRENAEDLDFGDINGRTSSLTFIKQTVNLRAKNFLPLYVQPLMTLVPISPQKMSQNPKVIDASCNILCLIVEFFTMNEQYAQYIPQLMAITVPLLLKSNNNLLVKRGCDLCVRLFSILNFKPETQLPQYILDNITILIQLLTSNDLISRVSAGSIIGRFIKYNCLQQSFKQILPQLFDVLLQTIKVYESEEVVDTLSDLIRIFPTETQPYSLDIVKGLMDAIIQIENNFSKLNESAQMNVSLSMTTAVGTITDIIQMNAENPNMMNGFIESFIPYLTRVLSSGTEFASENLDSIFLLLEKLVQNAPVPLHPQLQQLFTATLSLTVNNLTFDGIECAEPVISLYIAKQTELIYNEANMQLICRLIETTIQNGDQFDLELISVLRIANSVLTCADQRIDNFIRFIVRSLLPRMNNPDQVVALHGLETVLFTIFNNPMVALTAINEMGVLDNFIQFWYHFIPNKLISIADKKITLLAMVSLLTIPLNSLPNIITMNLPMFYNMMITLLIQCDQQRTKTEQLKAQFANSQSTIFSRAVKDLKDDEDVIVDDEDENVPHEYDELDMLADILDDGEEDLSVPLDEKEFVYELLKKVLEGELKDERHTMAIQSLPPQLKEWVLM